eukprot:TRINITY_DN9977_c0_g2_i1.p1 TRINITY_DN9977_c0_g2~~TRINITY_DN9977_c0_g2_i1.p1  ORF type:complete len:706 (-),score=128.36 TRINITY_DN9977_c0_g2_i1:61-2178(-)
MDPTSAEESTPWDPITGKLRAHSGLKLARGTRDALAKHTGDPSGLSSASTRCPTGRNTAATSAVTTAPGTPRRWSVAEVDDFGDLTQPLRGAKRSESVPRPPGMGTASGSGKRAVRFLAEQRSPTREKLPSAMDLDPGRYDVEPSGARRVKTSSSRTRDSSPLRRDNLPAAMRADPARYDVAPRGSSAACQIEEESRRLMHMKADPRNDMLNDGSGHNADGDGQTLMGMEVKERFKDMRTAFIAIDTDYDGRITKEELMDACKNWNLPLAEAERVMNCTDVDQKGFIDFDEFARRFDPFLEVSEDDEEILRLYQQGIMADEQPLKLAGVHHGTSSAEPLVDEALEYRTQNGDLRSRLARAMRRVSDLEDDLKASRAHAAELEVSLRKANVRNDELHDQNLELQRRNADMTRRLQDAEEDRRRAEERERRLANRLMDLESAQRPMMTDRYEETEEEAARRRARRRAEEADEADRIRRLERELAEANAERSRQDADHERNTVFVYGLEGCEKTEAVCKALKKAKVPFQIRDFNKDKRFMDIVEMSDENTGSDVHAPVVCLGNKAWWNHYEETQVVPFPQAVAMDLRHLLGLNKPAPERVRVDVDIDQEIFARFLSMQEAFLKIDDDRNGLITEDELIAKCREWHIPTSEAARVISEADRDDKGCLDFDEFAKRFSSLFNRGSLGPLRTISNAPNQPNPRKSIPAAVQ